MIKLVPVVQNTVEAMRYWHTVRNHKMVREWSRSAKAIPVADHQRWFAESLTNPSRRLYVALEEQTLVGIGRLDHRGTWTELSLAIHPQHHSLGYGRQLVQLLTREVFRLRWPAPGAVVSGRNEYSLRLFVRAGYITKAKKWIQLTYRGARS